MTEKMVRVFQAIFNDIISSRDSRKSFIEVLKGMGPIDEQIIKIDKNKDIHRILHGHNKLYDHFRGLGYDEVYIKNLILNYYIECIEKENILCELIECIKKKIYCVNLYFQRKLKKS